MKTSAIRGASSLGKSYLKRTHGRRRVGQIRLKGAAFSQIACGTLDQVSQAREKLGHRFDKAGGFHELQALHHTLRFCLERPSIPGLCPAGQGRFAVLYSPRFGAELRWYVRFGRFEQGR